MGEAAASVPSDVLAHTIERQGQAGEEIVKELETGRYDLVVLGSRGRGRVASELLGTVNGYVHLHSGVALLSIPDPEGAETCRTPGAGGRRPPRGGSLST